MKEVKDSYTQESINEKELFDILNNVKISEEELNLDNIEVTEKDIKEIKTRVFKNIKVNRRRNISAKGAAIAASIAAIFILSLIMYNPTALANIKGKLQFIQGMGVVETVEDNGEKYMLTKRAEAQYGNGKIIINSIALNSKSAAIVIGGESVPELWTVVLQNDKGERYRMWRSGGVAHFDKTAWCAEYKYSGEISISKNWTVILPKNLKIPVSLEKVNDIKNVSDLGPTATVNDVSVTAIPSLEDDKLRIGVFSPKNDSKKVLQYAVFVLPLDFKFTSKEQEKHYIDHSQIYLKDSAGNKYMGFGTRNVTLLDHEYYFKVGKNLDKEYTLTIPRILMEYNSKAECTIDLPKVGEAPLNKVVNLSGFPVNLLIERTSDDKLKVGIDVNYNKELPETLVSFKLDADGIGEEIGSGKQRELYSSPGDYEINVYKDQKQLKLVLKNPITEKKGPWNILIKFN